MKKSYLICALSIGASLSLSPYLLAAEPHSTTASDTVFADKAAEGGLTEVQLGKIAEKNAQSKDVKDFGARMVTDHTRINDKLKTVAKDDGLKLPENPSPDQQALISKLRNEMGSEFDQDYVQAMIKAHIGDEGLFTKEIASTQNPDIKHFAEYALPVIKEHLALINGIAHTHAIAFGGHKAKTGAQ